MEKFMADDKVQCAADEYFNHIINAHMSNNPAFLRRIIDRLELHYGRMTELKGNGDINIDVLPTISILGPGNVTLRFAEDRFYIVQSPVPVSAHMDDPKITTLRGKPTELLEYIRQGSAKTDDFQLRTDPGSGVIPVERVEILVIDQNDTCLTFPLRIAKTPLEDLLWKLVESDTN
jgi:hypothetical protein